jgi:hypothetical protein
MAKKRAAVNWDASHHGLHQFELHYEDIMHERNGKKIALWLLLILIPAAVAVPLASYRYFQNEQAQAAVDVLRLK